LDWVQWLPGKRQSKLCRSFQRRFILDHFLDFDGVPETFFKTRIAQGFSPQPAVGRVGDWFKEAPKNGSRDRVACQPGRVNRNSRFAWSDRWGTRLRHGKRSYEEECGAEGKRAIGEHFHESLSGVNSFAGALFKYLM
jgi:hypothetical protein